MPKQKETDPLRKWMKDNGVWQLDLCKMLEAEDVATLSDFKSLSKETVLELIDRAKKTGFMHASKLKELHGAFPKKKKKKKAAKTSNNAPRRKDPADLKREARPKLESFMRDNGIWQIDLFDLLTDEYEIYSPEEVNECRTDPDWVHQFLIDAKQCGVMGKQANTLAAFCGKKSKKKKKKKVAEQKQRAPRQKDDEEMKIEARPKLEKYLRAHDVWQIDLFDMMVDKYRIYSVSDFDAYQEDEEWVDEFLLEAKQCGVMGAKVKYLEQLVGRRKNVNKKKKKKKKKMAAEPTKKKELSPEEIENKARDKMEPFMQNEGFWHKDLFLILLRFDVYSPADMNGLSKSDKKEIIQQAKQKGLIGGKVKKFKAFGTNYV